MRVSAINNAYYAPKMRNSVTPKLKQQNYITECEPQPENQPAFKGFIKATIGTVSGAMIGFILGGPLLAGAAGALSGIIGGVQDENNGKDEDSDDSNYEYYDMPLYYN